MLIDCDSCAARGPACGDCVVTVLLGATPAQSFNDAAVSPGVDPGIDLDRREQAAIAVLAGSGLVPPLRLLRPPDPEQEADRLPVDGFGPEPDGDERRAAG